MTIIADMVRQRTRVQVALALAATVALVLVAAIVQRAAGPERLTPGAAVVLGLVEGMTEYLPVSSTGHLMVAGRLLGLGGNPAEDGALDTYAICIQLGAIAAVVLLYRQRLVQLAAGAVGRDPDGARILVALAAAMIPTVVLAVLLEDFVRENLFGPAPIAAAWVLGGLAILAFPGRWRSLPGAVSLPHLTFGRAAIIGVVQALALWPGISRSLVTIVAAIAVGLTLAAAVEFSFLLGLGTLTGATLYEAVRNGDELVESFGVLTPLLGLVVAFVSAVVAVRWMVVYLQSRGFELFGWYRVGIGAATAVAIAAGVF